MNKKETKTILLIDYNRKSGQFWTKAGRTNFQDLKKMKPRGKIAFGYTRAGQNGLFWWVRKGNSKLLLNN